MRAITAGLTSNPLADESVAFPSGYKQTAVGAIPQDWKTARIDVHASIKTGSRNTQDKKDDGKYPFFVRSQQVERINSYSYDGEAVLTAGDGVGTGKVFHYIKGRYDVHQRVYRISNFSDQLMGRYFFYQFSAAFYERIMSMTAKSSVDSVRMEMIAGMEIPLPLPPEQRAIAEALSDVDGLLAALEELIAKKRAIKQAAMQQLLTGKTRLPGFSGEWQTKQLGELCACLPTANNPRSDLNEHGEVEYIHYGDVHAHTRPVLDCTSCDLPRIAKNHVSNTVHLKDGDLVMVDASEDLEGVGKSVEIQGTAGKTIVSGLHTILCRGNRDDWAMGFKAYLQFNPTFRSALMRVTAGTSVYAISKKQLADAELCLPSLREQEAIVSVLSDMDAEITALERRRDKTRALKQGMMQALLTGRVRLVKPESTSEQEAETVASDRRSVRIET